MQLSQFLTVLSHVCISVYAVLIIKMVVKKLSHPRPQQRLVGNSVLLGFVHVFFRTHL